MEWFSDTEDSPSHASRQADTAGVPSPEITADYPFPTTANLAEMEGLNPFSAGSEGEVEPESEAENGGCPPQPSGHDIANGRREK